MKLRLILTLAAWAAVAYLHTVTSMHVGLGSAGELELEAGDENVLANLNLRHRQSLQFADASGDGRMRETIGDTAETGTTKGTCGGWCVLSSCYCERAHDCLARDMGYSFNWVDLAKCKPSEINLTTKMVQNICDSSKVRGDEDARQWTQLMKDAVNKQVQEQLQLLFNGGGLIWKETTSFDKGTIKDQPTERLKALWQLLDSHQPEPVDLYFTFADTKGMFCQLGKDVCDSIEQRITEEARHGYIRVLLERRAEEKGWAGFHIVLPESPASGTLIPKLEGDVVLKTNFHVEEKTLCTLPDGKRNPLCVVPQCTERAISAQDWAKMHHAGSWDSGIAAADRGRGI